MKKVKFTVTLGFEKVSKEFTFDDLNLDENSEDLEDDLQQAYSEWVWDQIGMDIKVI